MNTLTNKLIQKRLTFPAISGMKGHSTALARQLDVALMDNGFKLSRDLLKYLGGLEFAIALDAANTILTSVKELVGAHVKHNTYFIDFPKNVPDTVGFWGGLLAKYYEETGEYTNNLLDFPTYGKYQHTYEEMLERHDKWRGKVALKVINLGKSEREELEGLYAYLAGSNVPLNEDDRKLLADLYKAYAVDVAIPVRENKAIVNALRLGYRPLLIDTPVDVLRLAAYLSGGDVTLLEDTKFISFKRPVRRALVCALNEVLRNSPDKIEDINRYREQFKRLGSRLHPREFGLVDAIKAFDYAGGSLKIDTWGSKVHDAVTHGRITKAVNLLTEKPGYFVRAIDKLTRDASDTQFLNVVGAFKDNVSRVSGRVLLSLAEHLGNRANKPASRIFVNRAGKGYATENKLDVLPAKRVSALSKVIWKDLARRVPTIESLVVNDDISTVAVPLSEKTKSEGFRVLPRGSVLSLDNTQDVLRFFVYWHQTSERTDYDLSCAFYDEDFGFVEQISWTNIRGRDNLWGAGSTRIKGGAIEGFDAYHSGDIVDAPNGATEFIDINLKTLPKKIAYIIPTINAFAGEPFAKCKEAFMGFMSRKTLNKGEPFESKSVQTKFALRGDKNGVGIPMVFMRTDEGWKAKWLDLYSKGLPWGNRVEANKFSTALLARSMIDKQYLTMGRLLDLYRDKAKKVHTVDKLPKDEVTYVGLERPEGVKGQVYTLDNIKALIPA